MSILDARKGYLKEAKVVMKRMNYDWTHPDKAFIENEYEKCIKRKMSAGASREEIEAARKKYIQEQEQEGAEKREKIASEKKEVKVISYASKIGYLILVNCGLVCCLLVCCCMVVRQQKMRKIELSAKDDKELIIGDKSIIDDESNDAGKKSHVG